MSNTMAIAEEGVEMTGREQFAWVWLVTMIVTYVPYFAIITLFKPLPFLMEFVAFGATTGVQMITLAIAGLVMRMRREKKEIVDERDRAIEARASKAGYYLLMAGMIVVGIYMPFTLTGWDVAHAGIFAIVVAEIVRTGLVVLGYRRGWNG